MIVKMNIYVYVKHEKNLSVHPITPHANQKCKLLIIYQFKREDNIFVSLKIQEYLEQKQTKPEVNP